MVQVAVKTECFPATHLVQSSAARKSGVCTRERRQCNLSSYCAAPQPITSASCGGKCAPKWHIHGDSHTFHVLCPRALTPPLASAKSSPARPPSSRRAAAPGAGALCPLSGTCGRGAHRAGPWAAARAGAVRMRARAGKWLPARAQFFWRAARPPSGSALQPARGHIYLSQRSTVAVVASARRTPQSTPVRYRTA